jgi:EAL domain-containing protein (putative c-di-GMP-specific phosphodiesterase class I)
MPRTNSTKKKNEKEGLPRPPVQSHMPVGGELGAEVVAEGIETRDELSAVRDAGAQYGQGYLLGGPGFPKPPITNVGRARRRAGRAAP